MENPYALQMNGINLGKYSKKKRSRFMVNNRVNSSGFDSDIASIAKTFDVSYHDRDTHKREILKVGESSKTINIKNGDRSPRLTIRMKDAFKNRALMLTRDIPQSSISYRKIARPKTDVLAFLEHPQNGFSSFKHNLSTILISGKGSLRTENLKVRSGEYKLKIKVDGIEGVVVLRVHVPECDFGSYELVSHSNNSYECKKCGLNEINLDSKQKNCEFCPSYANCSLHYPLPDLEHWNTHPCSKHIKPCINPQACRNNRTELETLVSMQETCSWEPNLLELYRKSLCADGYRGVLCGSCNKDRGRSTSKCTKCGTPLVNVVLITLSTATITIVAILQIKWNLDCAAQLLHSDEVVRTSAQASRFLPNPPEEYVSIEVGREEESVDSSSENSPFDVSQEKLRFFELFKVKKFFKRV